ncbi:hypothetical protein PAL_GLEAN10014240 [Pteropus alecto]|uniref:BLOC-1-related complex subunit 7 n=1 Tax=Pteropus alecto TaxID=9402 RepID=L5K2M0_PTEAL|nr:hypothetical protein PAL_GLEAN10014240 [Pteropus alecto]
MATGTPDSQARFGQSVKGLLTEKVNTCGTDVIALTKQVLKGSRSSELLGQAARNMVLQEDAILHSEDSLRKMAIITTHLQYQQELGVQVGLVKDEFLLGKMRETTEVRVGGRDQEQGPPFARSYSEEKWLKDIEYHMEKYGFQVPNGYTEKLRETGIKNESECLGDTLYWKDLVILAPKSRFCLPRLVTVSLIMIHDEELERVIDNIFKFLKYFLVQ